MALTYRTRRSKPIPALSVGFEAAVVEFSAKFLTSSAFQHALTKGEQREQPIRRFFEDHLPQAFRIDSGEVVDLFGRTGPQLDLMISDRLRNFPIFRDTAVILPAEALLVSIEVKSELTLTEMTKTLAAAEKLRKLRPFKQPLGKKRNQGEPSDGRARYFHCVFAYKSDLARDSWLENEYSRVVNAAAKLGVSPGTIDRIYIANHGLINPGTGTGFDEHARPGSGLMQFYMHVLNFLGRENDRRDRVPYLEYAGKMAGGWRSLK
jgi:hypothetical protein